MLDVTKSIPAGKEIEIQGVSGDFIYMKFAGREVVVLVEGQPTTMDKGDLRREPTGFEKLTVYNPGTTDTKIIMTIGLGEFDRKIVQGEITITPGIKNEAGDFINDDREAYSALLRVKSAQPYQHLSGGAIDDAIEMGEIRETGMALVPDTGEVWVTLQGTDKYDKLGIYDAITGARIARAYDVPGLATGAGNRREWAFYHHGEKRLYLGRNYWTGSEYRYDYDIIDPVERTKVGEINGTKFQADTLDGGSTAVSLWDGTHDPVANRVYIVEQGGDLYCFDGDTGERLYKQVGALSDSAGIDYDEKSGYLVGRTGFNSTIAYFEDTGSGLEHRGAPTVDDANDGGPLAIWGHQNRIWYTSDVAGAELALHYLYDQSFAGDMIVNTDDLCATLFKAEGNGVLDSLVSFEAVPNTGYHTIKGAVIKAALAVVLEGEWNVPSDYLDYVYRFEYYDGSRRRVKSTGALSFAAADISDDFTVQAPDSVTITLRSGLLD